MRNSILTWREIGHVLAVTLTVLVMVWSLFGGIMLALSLAVGVVGFG